MGRSPYCLTLKLRWKERHGVSLQRYLNGHQHHVHKHSFNTIEPKLFNTTSLKHTQRMLYIRLKCSHPTNHERHSDPLVEMVNFIIQKMCDLQKTTRI